MGPKRVTKHYTRPDNTTHDTLRRPSNRLFLNSNLNHAEAAKIFVATIGAATAEGQHICCNDLRRHGGTSNLPNNGQNICCNDWYRHGGKGPKPQLGPKRVNKHYSRPDHTTHDTPHTAHNRRRGSWNDGMAWWGYAKRKQFPWSRNASVACTCATIHMLQINHLLQIGHAMAPWPNQRCM